jgi:hypothetical protein
LDTDIAVPPGRYDVFARILVIGEEENRSRAYLGFELDGEQIGTLATNLAGAESGWRWVSVGDVTVEAAAKHELALRAENRDNLVECYADLDKVAFVRAGTIVREERAITVASGELAVGPTSQKETDLVLDPRANGWHRFDVHIQETAASDTFNIHFWTQNNS